MITVLFILVILGGLFLLAAALAPPKAPLWISIFFLYVIELLRSLPIGGR